MSSATRKPRRRISYYGRAIPGSVSNYRKAVRFDYTDGCVGITTVMSESDDHLQGPIERVLLSPAQIRALVKFLTDPVGRGTP